MSLSTLARSGRRCVTNAVGKRPSLAKRGFGAESLPSGVNALYLESVYAQWKANPSALSPTWNAYFESMERTSPSALAPTGVTEGGIARGSSIGGLANLIRAYQKSGHRAAKLCPLGLHEWRDIFDKGDMSELTHTYHGFSEGDLDKPMDVNLPGLQSGATLRQIIDALQSKYCNSIGFEYRHITESEKVEWLRSRLESPEFLPKDKTKLLDVYEKLVKADTFETFLHNKYKTTKRFGVDGGEAAISGMDAGIHRAVELGVKEVVIGMPHRGRLNMLTNVVGKDLVQMFSEFRGTHYDFDQLMEEMDSADWSFSGDVKYHLGTSNVREFPGGKTARCTLECNPSHLETVNAVTLGRTRAKQFYRGNDEQAMKDVMPVVFHGDASFAGQGVVYETMQLADVTEFGTGGTIHVVINNQIGFTTDPIDDRSTLYCTDIGKCFNCPILHVNGDDPVATHRVFELAAEWRQQWGCDVVIDVICYRRFGHNETLNPDYTQPLLYKLIAKHPRGEKVFRDQLLSAGTASKSELDAIKDRIWQEHEEAFIKSADYKGDAFVWVATEWKDFVLPIHDATFGETGVEIGKLKKIGDALCTFPEGFRPHNGLRRQLKKKKEDLDAGTALDWGTCEALAFGSLLLEDNHVRITGQDSQTGTFAHRHAVARDNVTGEQHTFLNNLNLGPQAKFVARNSILAEYAVLGFELGYSYENPHALNIWEAQFGDFANTAQVVIDQFVSAGEHKWLQQSGIVMLLPHGYEGQGAEHSSCRLERYLQLCDDDEDAIPDFKRDYGNEQAQKANWAVVNLTTPANVFHAFRRQLHRDFRKPLVVASTKSLFRHKDCKSPIDDLGIGTRFQRLLAERDAEIAANPKGVDRLVFCSGKVYYDLVAEREKRNLKNVAIVTIEQIAPFPFDRVKQEMEKYPNVDVGDGVHPGAMIWCQEEPKNMGPWFYVKPRIVTTAREGINTDLVIRYVGRRAGASPATGYAKIHTAEQNAIVEEALIGHDDDEWAVQRPSGLLGHQT